MCNQQEQARINNEVEENKKIKKNFDYSKSIAWKKLTQIYHRQLRLVELTTIVCKAAKILNIRAPRISKRYKVPSIKFLNDNWDQIEPIINQITLTFKNNKVDDENQNETNCNLINQAQRFQVNFRNQQPQMQQQIVQLQQSIVQSQQNIVEIHHEIEPLKGQMQQLQQEHQNMKNEFSTQNSFHIKDYDVFDPNSDIVLNSRNVDDQDQQLTGMTTGDIWSNDSMQIEFDETFFDDI